MLAFVPVAFDVYRTVRRHLHWTLQNLVTFADRTGRCFPGPVAKFFRALFGRELRSLGPVLTQLLIEFWPSESPVHNQKLGYAAFWQARLRSWRQSRFWLPLWGPKPTEPGCFAPAALMT